MSKDILINCTAAEYRSLSELVPFQDNLKSLTKENLDKFKKNLIENGFCEPVSIWNNNIISGHQRVISLKALESDGYNIPPIPVNIIKAKTQKQAKKIVLALATQYGNLSQESVCDFVLDNELDYQEIDCLKLPGISMDKEKEPKDKKEKHCPHCGCVL